MSDIIKKFPRIFAFEISFKRIIILLALVLIVSIIMPLLVWWQMITIVNIQNEKIHILESQRDDLSNKINNLYK